MAIIAWHFGYGFAAFAALVFTWAMIALAFIDIDTQLFPNDITLPLLWTGLLVNLADGFTDISSAVLGAVAGYIIVMVDILGVQTCNSKGRHGLWRFQTAGGDRCMAGVANASARDFVFLGGRRLVVDKFLMAGCETWMPRSHSFWSISGGWRLGGAPMGQPA